MTYLVLLLCLQITTIYAMPLQLQLLQPMLQPQTSLQQQLLQLQQLQALQQLNMVQTRVGLNQPRPLLILLPKANKHIETNEDLKNLDNTNLKYVDPKHNHGIEDQEAESIVIDADVEAVDSEPPRAVLLIPNDGRFSIGGFISSIPFLPFEVNVPDTISWMYNGISSIISGIGQRITFRPQTAEAMASMNQKDGNLRFKQPHKRNTMPVLVMPLVYP